MTSVIRHQLSRLDQTLLALANERARLLGTLALEERGNAAAVNDLLRRNTGPISADGLRGLFDALERACAEVAHGCSPFRATTPERDAPDGRSDGGAGR